MDRDGYPDEEDLSKIKLWDHDDPIGLVEFLRSIWYMSDRVFRGEWGHDELSPRDNAYILRVSTVGWSGNETLINALEKTVFWLLYWEQSRRGGHYVFHVKPKGYLLVSDYCKKHGVSRQSVYQSKEKFEWLYISHKKRMIRRKPT